MNPYDNHLIRIYIHEIRFPFCITTRPEPISATLTGNIPGKNANARKEIHNVTWQSALTNWKSLARYVIFAYR